MTQTLFRGAPKYLLAAKAVGFMAFLVYFFLKRGELSDYVQQTHTSLGSILNDLEALTHAHPNVNETLRANQPLWQTYTRIQRHYTELSDEIQQVDLKRLSRNAALYLCVQCNELIAELIGLAAVKLDSIGYFIEDLEQYDIYQNTPLLETVAALFPLKHTEKANFNAANADGFLRMLGAAYPLRLSSPHSLSQQD